jgi:hypothetical protein
MPFSQYSEIMTRRRLLQRTLAFILLATPAFGSLTHRLAARYSPDNTQLFNRELDRNLVDRELEGDDAAAADAAEAQALANGEIHYMCSVIFFVKMWVTNDFSSILYPRIVDY